VIIQLTVNNTRSLAQKKALYRRIVELLTESPGLRPEDIFISLVEVLPENWSLGHGEAQYAPLNVPAPA
jgi:phenylpyruvate tautomerase PptA (4-oxalocrotonate tautomerase family)